MNTARFVVPILVVVGVYFLFFSSNLPGDIEFQGHTLGPRESVENNSLKEFDIYSYSDDSRDRLLLLVMSSTDESPPPAELLAFYIQNFKAQGFSFKTDDKRHLGIKGDEVIYMTLAPRIDSAVAYIEKSATAPTSMRGASDIFSNLEGLSLE